MSKKELTNEEKLNILIPKAMSVLCDMVEQRMPEEGQFQKFFVSFEYPGTKCEALLWMEPNLTGRGGNGRVTTAMHEVGSDRVVQHYTMVGNKTDIVRWLQCSGNASQLQTDYDQLKQAINRFD